MGMVFTRDDLAILKRKNLLLVAEYYGLKVKPYWTKDQIIDAIMPTQIDESNEYSVPMSARVRRIMIQNKGA